MGGDPLIVPPVAGILMNDSDDGLRYVVLEVHYTNPNHLENLVDYSGIKMTWTKQLREHNAGFMMMGDPLPSASPIPARTSDWSFEGVCPPQCTSTWTHDITVFQSFLHMHQIGSMMWSQHWSSKGQSLGFISRAEYYAFEHQHLTPSNLTISRGDRINTHCIWDSSERANETRMGGSSFDEMCVHLIMYYPVLFTPQGDSYLMCGHNRGNTICGTWRNYTESRKPIENPGVFEDPDGNEIRLFGQPKCQHTADDDTVGKPSDSKWSNYYLLIIFFGVGIISAAAVIIRRRKTLRLSGLIYTPLNNSNN